MSGVDRPAILSALASGTLREVHVERVLLTPAATALVPREQWFDLAPDVTVETLHEGDVIPAARWSSSTDSAVVVGVGSTPDDTFIRSRVDVYVHVGPMHDLVGSQGVTVPLIDQQAAGVRNVLRWAQSLTFTPQRWATHGAIAAHAEHAAAQYSSPEHVKHAEEFSRAAAEELAAAFPEVIAVLGTGFPFYCMADVDDGTRDPVPPSILQYTAEQREMFTRKLLPLHVLRAGPRQWTPAELAAAGVDVGQTRANAYEYLRHGVAPPVAPPSGLIEEFEQANACVRADRLWPCHVCTTLHDRRRFPDQSWERDFMQSCVKCAQTPYLPRAVGVLSSDIDLVALTRPGVGSRELCERITAWIDEHPQYYRHDTRWDQQLNGPHGPLDVFVTSAAAFLDAARAMGEVDGWLDVTLPCSVTWLPVTDIDYEIGKYLPLCMELLLDRSSDGGVRSELIAARAAFASHVPATEVLGRYREDSSYLRQLASNPQIAALLQERNVRWRAAGMESGEAR